MVMTLMNPVIVTSAAIPASRPWHAIQSDDAATTNLTSDIALELTPTTFKLGVEAHDKAARAHLAHAPAFKINIAKPARIALAADRLTALTHRIPTQIALIIIITISATVMSVMNMAARARQRQLSALAQIHGYTCTRARFDAVRSSGSGEERGRSQGNGRHSRSYDASHHGTHPAPGASNRA